MFVEYYNEGRFENSRTATFADALRLLEKNHLAAMREREKTEIEHILYGITIYDENDNVEKIMLFRNTYLTDQELDAYIANYKRALFYVIHGNVKKSCKKVLELKKHREIRPINLKTANEYVTKYHRHHNGTVGCKFAIGLYEAEKLIGVAICGRPVSRYLDNGDICEINRLCTQGGENACSMLYGACCRIAKDMGYKKIITYILKSESGITLRASNFICEGEAGGTHWTGKRNKGQNIPPEIKTRWSKNLGKLKR